MKICVIRGRQREKNLRHLRNLREKEIRENLCNPWETKRKIIHHPNNQIKSVIIRVIRGRLK